jgi:hypothetical protein
VAGALKLSLGGTPVVLQFQSSPLATTIADLAPYLVSDLDGYTVGMLDQGEGLRLVMQGGAMPLLMGTADKVGIIERLTDYTILDLDPYTIAELDNL